MGKLFKILKAVVQLIGTILGKKEDNYVDRRAIPPRGKESVAGEPRENTTVVVKRKKDLK